MTFLIKILEYFARRKFGRSSNLIIGENTILKYRKIRCVGNANTLKVGKNSYIDCNIVFEKKRSTIVVGDNTFIGSSMLACAEEISIGNNVQVAWGCTFLDHNSHSLDYKIRRKDLPATFIGKKDWGVVKTQSILIADDVWIGFNVIILKGVSVGKGSIIAAGSVVVKNVPSFVVVAGNPATIVKYLSE